MAFRSSFRRGGFSLALALGVILAAGGAQAADPFEAKSHRWEEDYAWMADARTEPQGLERLKFIPLAEDRQAWLTLGGEVRQRIDRAVNGQLGLSHVPRQVTYQTRLYLHADAHLTDTVRVFGQLSWADEGGRKGADRSFDESGVDVQQLFVDLAPTDELRLRLGRQELPLGDQRLSEVRETYDLRRSFDGARLDYAGAAGVHLTAFAADLVVNRPGAFDDRRVKGETFTGLYASRPLGGPVLDLFWLERRKPAATFAEGTAKERRETWGARLHGERGALDYNFYAVGQSGRFGPRDIRAWAVSADLGWTFEDHAWAPRLSLRADAASGDGRKGDGRLETFDAPYPNTSYLSTSSAYWPGNAWSVFPLLSVKPRDSLTIYLGAQSMSRMSKADAFYYSAQSPNLLPTGHGQVAMRQVYARVRYEPVRNLVTSATVIRQFAGDPVVARGGQDSTIVSLSAGLKF